MRIGGKFEARTPGRFETPFGGKVGANMQFAWFVGAGTAWLDANRPKYGMVCNKGS